MRTRSESGGFVLLTWDSWTWKGFTEGSEIEKPTCLYLIGQTRRLDHSWIVRGIRLAHGF
jgi:hypothetical protein